MQDYDYFLVLDFEATCDDEKRIPYNEIIEFPTCAVNSKTGKIDYEFHQYVKPSNFPQLTSFCHDLTGIKQEWVDRAKLLREVLVDYDKWLIENRLKDQRIIWVTCGDWDLQKMLPSQCRREKIELPSWVRRFGWINIKKSFNDHFKEEARGMANMLRLLKIELEGRHHSGIDDSRNTAKILIRMLEEGYKFKTEFHNISITGQYVSLGEEFGSVCLSCWFPNHSHVQNWFQKYGTPSMIVTCMNKREGGRKVSKFMNKVKNENVEHFPVSHAGLDLLLHEKLKDDINHVVNHLRSNSENRVMVICQDGWRKSSVFLYLVLRQLEIENREAFRVLKYSRYKSVEKFDEKRMEECEDFKKKYL